MTTLRHHIRNGVVGVYAERKKLLTEMLNMATALESRRSWTKTKVVGELTEALRGQMACIRRMDLHLERVMKALIEQAIEEKKQKEKIKKEDEQNEKENKPLAENGNTYDAAIRRGAVFIRRVRDDADGGK